MFQRVVPRYQDNMPWILSMRHADWSCVSKSSASNQFCIILWNIIYHFHSFVCFCLTPFVTAQLRQQEEQHAVSPRKAEESTPKPAQTKAKAAKDFPRATEMWNNDHSQVLLLNYM